MKQVFLAWRDPGQRWFPVGVLTREGALYTFRYTRGAVAAAEQASFLPLASFPDPQETYQSRELFPVFANRILSAKRQEFPEFLRWLDLRPEDADPLVLLARSTGRRETDTFELFARPERTADGLYQVRCFVHGIRHREPAAIATARQLRPGDRLVVVPEPTNAYDQFALRTLTEEGGIHIGYLPRYLNQDAHRLGLENLDVWVERVNAGETPLQFLVQCRLSAPWPAGFEACCGELYEPIAGADSSTRRQVAQA